MKRTEQFDVVIVGAGPAGSTCALALKDSGLKVALIDRATFPRDKVCGDAIPGLAVKTLHQLDPSYTEIFDELPAKCFTKRSHFWINNEDYIEIKWVNKAFTCARMDFDNQLFELADTYSNATIFQNTALKSIERKTDHIELVCKSDLVFQAKMVVGCDGAHSIVSKQLTDYKVDLAHYGGAVRAYYTNVTDVEADCTEIYIQKQHLPGYFWLFPLPNGRANVGLGMHSSHISKHKVNLKTAFQAFIDASPILTKKLQDAQIEDKITGFGLPFGSKKVQVSGDHFLLTGDAASLIDPATGDGIGQAIYSGKLAGEWVSKAFQKNRFDATFLKQYDVALYKKLWGELRTRTLVQRSVSRFPWLLDAGVALWKNPITNGLIKRFV